MKIKIGRLLVVVGAVLTLFSTFFLSFGETAGTLGRTHISGIGFLFNLPDIWGNVASWEAFNGGTATLIYVFSVIFIVFVLSGVIQLIGYLNKYVAISGSVIAIVFGAFIIIFITHIPPWNINRYSSLFWSAPIVDGVLAPIWPLDIYITAVFPSVPAYVHLSLGTITLVIGGSVGLVGGILGIKDI
ncbi:MAG: hypothetical protein ACW98X_11145 [Promethearchaeota archaeon]|jgi:hypothetical protein